MIDRLLMVSAALVLATSIAVVVIVLLRPMMLRAGGAVAVLRLWWILPVAMIVALTPKEVTFVTAAAQLVRPDAQVVEVKSTPLLAALAPAPAEITLDNIAPSVADFPLSATIPWVALAFSLWLVGATISAAWLCLAQRRFAEAIVWKNGRGQLPAHHAPSVVGAWHPRLVLPADFAAQFDPEERRLVLLHERIHMSRRDGAANLAMAVLLVLQWFNPLVHWAARAMRGDQECACDAIVVSRHPQSIKSYTSALMKSLPQVRLVPLACSWHRTHPFVSRLGMLKAHRDASPRRVLAGALLLVGAVLGSALAYAAKPAIAVAVEPVAWLETTPVPTPVADAVTPLPTIAPISTPRPVTPIARSTKVSAPSAFKADPAPQPAPVIVAEVRESDSPIDVPSTGHFYYDCMNTEIAAGKSRKEASPECSKRFAVRLRECGQTHKEGTAMESLQAVHDCVPIPLEPPTPQVKLLTSCDQQAKQKDLVDAPYDAFMKSCTGATFFRSASKAVGACQNHLKTLPEGDERYAQAKKCAALIREDAAETKRLAAEAEAAAGTPVQEALVAGCPAPTDAQLNALRDALPPGVDVQTLKAQTASVLLVGRVNSNKVVSETLRNYNKLPGFHAPNLISIYKVQDAPEISEFTMTLAQRC